MNESLSNFDFKCKGYDSENEIRSAGDLCKYRPQVQNNIFPKTGLEANEQNEIKKNQLLDT